MWTLRLARTIVAGNDFENISHKFLHILNSHFTFIFYYKSILSANPLFQNSQFNTKWIIHTHTSMFLVLRTNYKQRKQIEDFLKCMHVEIKLFFIS